MRYCSTNGRSPHVSFAEAVINGQPDDGGLYFPESIPQFEPDLITDLDKYSDAELAFHSIKDMVGDAISPSELMRICDETLSFPIPLVSIDDDISVLELFHGPTLAFKDVGARFMSRCLGHFTRGESSETVVIVATSGDTGGAVAAGFHGVEGVKVIILYPKGKVSRVQEQQLTTHGGNVITLEVRGTFDDCQRLAKASLRDEDIRSRARLTSANSINVARWLPQQFYYLIALRQWLLDVPPVMSVPSGNFGNIAAGILSNVRGLPIKRFIAACNANDVVPRFLAGGEYLTGDTVATISNAMDVGDPSNFVRILRMLGETRDDIASRVTAISINDERTRATIRDVYSQCNYTLDPHTAVGVTAMRDDAAGESGIVLATAHPIKFDVVSEILETDTERPASLAGLDALEKHSIETSTDLSEVKDVILSVI